MGHDKLVHIIIGIQRTEYYTWHIRMINHDRSWIEATQIADPIRRLIDRGPRSTCGLPPRLNRPHQNTPSFRVSAAKGGSALTVLKSAASHPAGTRFSTSVHREMKTRGKIVLEEWALSLCVKIHVNERIIPRWKVFDNRFDNWGGRGERDVNVSIVLIVKIEHLICCININSISILY